jgi:hypothetical protein
MPGRMDDEDKQDSMARENPYIKDIIDAAANRPEEVCITSV